MTILLVAGAGGGIAFVYMNLRNRIKKLDERVRVLEGKPPKPVE